MAFRSFVKSGAGKEVTFVTRETQADVGSPPTSSNKGALVAKEALSQELLDVEEYVIKEPNVEPEVGRRRVSKRHYSSYAKVIENMKADEEAVGKSASVKRGRNGIPPVPLSGKGVKEKTQVVPNYVKGDSDIHDLAVSDEGLSFPLPEDCRALLFRCVPPGWADQFNHYDFSKLIDLQAQASLQSAVMNVVLNAQTIREHRELVECKAEMALMFQGMKEASKKVLSMEKQLKALSECEDKKQLQSLVTELEARVAKERLEISRLRLVEIGFESQLSNVEKKREELVVQNESLNLENEQLKERCEALVTHVIPHIAYELVRSDEVGEVMGEVVEKAMAVARNTTLEEVAAYGRPVVLADVEGYNAHSTHEYDVVSEAFTQATFPFVDEVVAHASGSVEDLLALKPKKLPHPSV